MTKEDFLNFNIENIWKEMEEIGRAKQAAQELFSEFQSQYYDRKAANLFDIADCSPTKRLISMKNATAKHHVIEAKTKEINDGKYALKYTASPKKSYVVKPDDGEIKYDDFSQK